MSNYPSGYREPEDLGSFLARQDAMIKELEAENAALALKFQQCNCEALALRVQQFDRCISRIGHHIGAVCAGVDTEEECGPGGHSAVAIIAKFDEKEERIAELTRVIADLRGALTTISRAQQNAVSFRDLCVYAKKAVAGIVEEKCPQD